MNDMELAILDIIKEVYKKEYTGGLKVTKKGDSYILRMFFGNADKTPLVICADLNSKDFLEFVRQELISRLLIKTKYYTGYKIYEEGDCRESW